MKTLYIYLVVEINESANLDIEKRLIMRLIVFTFICSTDSKMKIPLISLLITHFTQNFGSCMEIHYSQNIKGGCMYIYI